MRTMDLLDGCVARVLSFSTRNFVVLCSVLWCPAGLVIFARARDNVTLSKLVDNVRLGFFFPFLF